MLGRRTSRNRSNPAVPKPIRVFISSSQNEFLGLRRDLRDQINDYKIATRKLFDAELVEEGLSATFQADIDRGLDAAAFYVAIIGYDNSDWTADEFKEAWIRGLSVLIYDFRRNVRRGRKTKLVKYFDSLKGSGLRIQKPQSRYRTEQDLINHVLSDLLPNVTEIVKNHIATRRMLVHKAKLGIPSVST